MFDEIFLTFLECAKRGRWEPLDEEVRVSEKLERNMNGYRAFANDAEVWIVREDGLRRAFSFKSMGKIWIGNGMIKFYNYELAEEIAVDEDTKSGHEHLGKLDFGK